MGIFRIDPAVQDLKMANEPMTVDEVVFARDEDLRLLGARTLEGFAARVDPRQRRLVASGPSPVG